MRTVEYAINVTLDGCCDHTQMIADDELHDFFTDLLRRVDLMIFGRRTYQLMESAWPAVAQNQSETKALNEFALMMDSIRKIVFSKTMKKVEWKSAEISRANVEDELQQLRQEPGKNISVDGIRIAAHLTRLGLIDEYHIVVHPVVAGKGPRLFEEGALTRRVPLTLVETKTLRSGVVALHYKKTVK